MVGSRRLEVLFQDSANYVFVDAKPKGSGNLFSDPRAPAPGVAAFELKNGLNDFWAGTFGS